MEVVLSESTNKIKGVIERQNHRLTNKYAPPNSKTQRTDRGPKTMMTQESQATDIQQFLASTNDLTGSQQTVGRQPRSNRSPPAPKRPFNRK